MRRHKLCPRRSIPTRPARGLTLVELMTMLLVIGVLAAVAMPKYADVQMRARSAKLKSTAQTLQWVSTLARTMADGQRLDCHDPAPARLSVDGTPIVLVHCHPQALASFDEGLLAAARLLPADGWQFSLAPGQTGGGRGGASLVIELADAPVPAQCATVYTAANAGTPPQIGTLTAGC